MDEKQLSEWAEPSAFLCRSTIYTLNGFLSYHVFPCHTANFIVPELKHLSACDIPSQKVFYESVYFQGMAIFKLMNYHLYSDTVFNDYRDYVTHVVESINNLHGVLK